MHNRTRPTPLALISFSILALLLGAILQGHEATPVTHAIDNGQPRQGPQLEIRLFDQESKASLSGRISLKVDDAVYVPDWANEHGIRFTSIHKSKQQFFTVLYALETGTLLVSLPEGAQRVEATAARGLEYLPATASTVVKNGKAKIALQMKRWIALDAQGWTSIDEHLHYDRLHASDDGKWLAMLEADGLTGGHFMVLKGGMVNDIWSRQFAYGKAGQADNGRVAIVPGQEYRDSAMGHINLLGINQPIEPYSTGGMGWPKTVENYPPFYDVLAEARNRGALTGAAHGGSLGKYATAEADAVLGGMDYWEISNGFIYQVEAWYRLMNCGYVLPPLAGTDLPNSPFREPWQPLFGSIRSYAQTGGDHTWEAFQAALRQGRVFISGGPIISIEANGQEMGDTLRLEKSGFVTVRATLSSPRELRAFKLVHNGVELSSEIRRESVDSIQRWTIEQRIRFDKSGWVAAWGKGASIPAQEIDAMAHTNAIRVLVGDQPIRSEADAALLIQEFQERRNYYQSKGVYKNEDQRRRAVGLLDQAIAKLKTD